MYKSLAIAVPAFILAIISSSCDRVRKDADVIPSGADIKFVRIDKEDKVDVLIGGRLFTSYLYQDKLPRPVLFPLITPSGIAVNRYYPIVEVEGEKKVHPHHTGLFFAYRQVNDDDFWLTSASPARIRHEKITKMVSDGGRGTLSTLSSWVGKNGNVLLQEKREMTFTAGKEEDEIDLDITLTAQDAKVVFGDSKEGVLAVQLAEFLSEQNGTGRLLDSHGREGTKQIWGKRADWVSVEGTKDGKQAGIAVFNHPSSVNYPAFWHVRDYGLLAANPLGQYVFEKANNPDTAKPLNMTLEPGKSAVFRFHVLVYAGRRTAEQIEKRFEVYAKQSFD